MNGAKQATLTVDWKYADDFRRIYATNVFGLAGDHDYRLFLGVTSPIMQTNPDSTPTAQGDYKVEVMLPFVVLKQMRNILDVGIKLVERRFGEITILVSPDDRLVA